MADIFISYASEDRSRVEPLSEALEDQGWSVFWDTKIPVGKTWRQAITKELKAAKCAVVIWSSISINSEFVHEEAEEAQDRKIFVPVMIDNVKPPLGFRRLQSAKLIKWAGESNDPEFEKLLVSIEAILSRSPTGKLSESKTDSTASSETKLTKTIAPVLSRTSNALKLVIFAGVAILLIFGIWWYISKPQESIMNSLGMKFVLIPAGKFVMGSPPDELEREYQERQHEVSISKPFYLQTTEVSQGQWEKVMGDNPSRFKDCGADCPVENVSWNDARNFIRKLNQMEGANKYRLPTEAEWEYACRAETTTRFFTGDCIATDQANYHGNYPGKWCPIGQYRGKTIEVGRFQPNSWGLYDMHGNVWEWCKDWYGDYPFNSVVDPKGPDTGKYPVLRGGAFSSPAPAVRSAVRYSLNPDARIYWAGFRVARDF